MKKLGATLIVGALVASNAFAAGTSAKGVDAVRSGKDMKDSQVISAKSSAVRVTEDAAKKLVDQVNSAGLKVDSSQISSKLKNGSEDIETSYKTADGKSVSQKISLGDMISQSTASHVKSESQKELASNILDVATLERGVSKDSGMNKLLAEALATLEPGSKATDAERASFSAKLASISEAVRTGKANDIDEASKKILTAEERKKLEECIRG
jgi:hypothetical protein